MAKQTRQMWRKKLDPSKIDEYIYAHDNIWPEISALIKEQGVRNYSIFLDGDELIAYLEHDDIEELDRINANPKPIAIEWENYMRPLSEDKISPDQGMRKINRQVFYAE